jgi:hypothetical protein
MERTVFVEFGAPIAVGLVATLLAWVILRYWPRGKERPVTLVRYVHNGAGKEIGRYTVACRTVGEALDADHRIRINTDFLLTIRASATEPELAAEAETVTTLREKIGRRER